MGDELDALDPQPEQVKLTTGTVVQLEALRARQFFKFLRILTHGALPNLRDANFLNLTDLDDQAFMMRLMSLVVLSIPDAEDETIEFVRAMCRPVGLIERRGLNKADTERNNELWTRLYTELDNPELDDLITLVEAIVRREAEDIKALGKRLRQMFNLAEKTGQLKSPSSPAANSSADSPEPSTSSPPSTGGRTTTSPTSHSSGSVKSPRPSGNADSSFSGSESSG